MVFEHKPVLFNETIEAMCIKPDGVYVDGTAGGGGHSSAIAERLTTGRLIAIDQDPDAIEAAGKRLRQYNNVEIVRANFSKINSVLDNLNIDKIDGFLMDIGVSSHQLDTPERGFSYHFDAPLDMRMKQEGISAADIVNSADEFEIKRILLEYGEEKYAGSIAKNIVAERIKHPIETTFELNKIIDISVPMKAKRDGHPARKTYQALRIAVNRELECLEKALDDGFERLKSGGRMCVITFHSLEDRIVKRRFKSFCEGCTCPPDFPVCVCGKAPRGKMPFKVVKTSGSEMSENFRARSAKLRCIEKI